jgi:protein subunit release factor A
MVDRDDFRVDVYRTRDEGSGGNDWAARVTHVPSGTTAIRQGEGSDLSDRETAIESAIKEIEAQLAG